MQWQDEAGTLGKRPREAGASSWRRDPESAFGRMSGRELVEWERAEEMVYAKAERAHW